MVPKGFQSITGLGSCPSDWLVKPADELTSKITKGTTPPKTEIVSDSKIPFLRVNNLGFNGELDTSSDMIFVTQEAHNNSLARSIAYPGDILMNIVGPPLGKIAMLSQDFDEYNMNQAIVIYRTISSKVNKDYFLNFLSSELAQQWLQSRSKKTSGQQNLTIQLCKELPVPTPPLPEQQKIAKILSTWDKAISTTERLIDNSTQQKKALMQQLLTGKKRLLDKSGQRFAGDWEQSTLGSICKFSQGFQVGVDEQTPEQKDSLVRFIRIVDYTKESEPARYIAPKSNYYKVDKQDVVMVRYGEAGLTCRGYEGVIANNLFLISPDKAKLSKAYLFKFLRYNFKKISVLAASSTMPALKFTDLKTFKIQIPKIDEQQKISTVLTNADKEIELLEQQLADLQQEKKALMHQLLTGQKRVVVDGE